MTSDAGALRRLERAFGRGPRAATVALWLLGAAMAAWSASVSVRAGHTGQAAVYVAVTLVLFALGWALWSRHRLAEAVSAVALAASLPGVVGSAIELATGVAAAKAAELQTLGVAPRLAVSINLAYCALGAALAVWLGVRLRSATDRRLATLQNS